METKQRKETQYAKNIQGTEFHISEVERGLKGYYCIDCNEQMVACISTEVSSYFRHHVTDVTVVRECTFSNETYRHELAKKILQRIKQIKVPAVNKYPPKGSEGKMRLKDVETVHAHSVGVEYRFYEDETSQIRWMGNPDWVDDDPNKRLIIQPDITFFDHQGNPILFIEIVATHKADDEKLSKLKRLGINTVSVTIPKESATAIEQIFYTTDRTYWLYNHEEEAARYVPIPGKYSEDLLPAEKLQKRLLEESINCRTTAIGNLIRAIRVCLGSEQYRAVRGHLEQEISRITDNTTREQRRLLNLQTAHKKRIESPFRGRMLKAAKTQRKLSATHKNLESRYHRKADQLYNGLSAARTEIERRVEQRREDLEQRYKAKRDQLDYTADGYRSEYQDDLDRVADEIERVEIELERFGPEGGELDALQERLDDEAADSDQEISRIDFRIREVKQRRATLQGHYQSFGSDLVETYRQQKKTIGTIFSQQTREIQSTTEREQERVRAEHDRFREQAIDAVTRRNGNGVSRLSSRIAELVKAGRLVIDTTPKYAACKRLRTAFESFKSGAYKNWI